MSKPIIEVESLSKLYHLGTINATSLRESAERLWFRLLHKEDALKKVGHEISMIDPNDPQAGPEPNTLWALKDVTFSVNQGDVIGIIGKNGSGKSTLLKILSRITEPTQGKAIVRGRVASLLEVGTGFHPELTGRDNIYLNGAILGMRKSEIDKKFDSIVDFAEIEKFIDTPVKRYSSGMYVRLAFAVAAHLEPEILFIDEVLAVGDAEFQKKCLGKMSDISKSDGRTILFVSHNMAAVNRLCGKCVLLKLGNAMPPMDVSKAVDIYSGGKNLSGLEIDLSQIKRTNEQHGRICKLEKVSLLKHGQLAFRKPLEVEFVVSCKQKISNLMVAIAFNTLQGQRILTLDSDTGGKRFDLEPGKHLIKLSLDSLPLHPAQYLLSSAVFSGAYEHDLLVDYGIWEVTPSDQDYLSDRSFGGCRFEPIIKVHSI